MGTWSEYLDKAQGGRSVCDLIAGAWSGRGYISLRGCGCDRVYLPGLGHDSSPYPVPTLIQGPTQNTSLREETILLCNSQSRCQNAPSTNGHVGPVTAAKSTAALPGGARRAGLIRERSGLDCRGRGSKMMIAMTRGRYVERFHLVVHLVRVSFYVGMMRPRSTLVCLMVIPASALSCFDNCNTTRGLSGTTITSILC